MYVWGWLECVIVWCMEFWDFMFIGYVIFLLFKKRVEWGVRVYVWYYKIMYDLNFKIILGLSKFVNRWLV